MTLIDRYVGFAIAFVLAFGTSALFGQEARDLYVEAGCDLCHGADMTGEVDMTADMTDGVWQYLGEETVEGVLAIIRDGLEVEGAEVMAPDEILNPEQQQALAVYVWSVNGGEGEAGGATMSEEDLVAMGADLFVGDGECNLCHGDDATGEEDMTADLTDGEWQFLEMSSVETIITLLKTGLTEEEAGMEMAPVENLTDEQLKALAVYVMSLNAAGGEEAAE